MRVRIADSSLLEALIAFLEEHDCVVQALGDNELEVNPLGSARHDVAPLELDLYLRLWAALHPEAEVDLVDA